LLVRQRCTLRSPTVRWPSHETLASSSWCKCTTLLLARAVVLFLGTLIIILLLLPSPLRNAVPPPLPSHLTLPNESAGERFDACTVGASTVTSSQRLVNATQPTSCRRYRPSVLSACHYPRGKVEPRRSRVSMSSPPTGRLRPCGPERDRPDGGHPWDF